MSPDELSSRIWRLRAIARFMDEIITLPGKFRIGLDPLIGLIPGLGDLIGAIVAAIIVIEAARMGAPAHILLRMVVNIAIDTLIGAIPILGDLFDFGFKANSKNVSLLESHFLGASS